MNENQKPYSGRDNQLLVRGSHQHGHLPSVDVRELAPQFQDEIHLRDYLDVLILRKWIVVTVLLAIFFSVAIVTFSMTPQFKADASLKVSANSQQLTKFDSLEGSALKTMEFQQTQVKLLQSEQLAGRVIDLLELTENKVFNPNAGTDADLDGVADKSFIKGIFATLKNFVRADEPRDSMAMISEEVQQQVLYDKVLIGFAKRFTVTPVRNSELIVITFETPDPVLSADITNSAMDEFINMHMDGNIKASQDASRFLDKRILAAQIKLEKSEIALQEFARKIGVVSLDPKLNMVFRQMEELNEALAESAAERIRMEARYVQTKSLNAENLTKILDSDIIQNLKMQHAVLNAEYEDLETTFKPGYPKLIQLKARMDDLEQKITIEKSQILSSVQNDYEVAVKTEQYLQTRAETQKQRSLDLEEKATQYKIYQREVESSKSIYNSLLQRSKEIEATIGAAVTNIQIIDTARPPLYPGKPKVKLNLLLGIVLGLFSGIGAAFLVEYFDNTIKNPDEMRDRFNIPVLGLIPYDKKDIDNRNGMALKFHNEPRSPVAEAFRTTMASVRLSVTDNPPRSILVTSILPGAGKSTLSSNACLSYLAEDETCLLIDADLRKPSLHKIFKKGVKGKGLSSVLSGMSTLKDAVSKTEYKGLDFISSGPLLPVNPAELLSSKRMRQLLRVVGKHYDRVIVDGPPYQGFAEILVLANMVDGVILVSVEGDTPREGVKHFKGSLTNVGGRIIGAIINKCGRKKGYGSYSGYEYYQYNYEYGNEKNG